jgi:hypothetical protein
MKKIILTIVMLSILNASEERPTRQDVSKLYVATFNRAPDDLGLTYWTDKSHFTLSQIARSFFDQEETHNIYPDTISNHDFIKTTYQNLFNRDPDSEGWGYWEEYLDKNLDTKNLFILTLINGAKGSDATILEHKASVGVSFADASYDDLILSHSVMSGVTSDISTVEYIQDRIDSHSLFGDVWSGYTPSSTHNWYKPTVGATWQWQIEGTLHTSYSVDIYDIDLLNSSRDEIKALQDSGKRVICYFSAGSSEDWREDFYKFPTDKMGNDLDGWEGERWLDIRAQEIRDIMTARLDIAKEKGCDGVEPDNVDGYINSSGFDLTTKDQLEYNRFIANEAHKRGLSVGLKNDSEQVKLLVDFFDFAITEECHLYEECRLYLPFIEVNKPVLNAEYANRYIDDPTQRDAICQEARSLKIETLILPLGLDDEFRYSCSL